MTVAERNSTEYLTQIDQWRQDMEAQLRAADGWLTVVGLYWLHDGINTVGSDPASDVALPESVPAQVGIIDFHDGKATFTATTETPVQIDGAPVQTADLHHDQSSSGATLVNVGSVTFHIIKRGEQYGVRVRDSESESRRTFGGRAWFPTDERYRVAATFVPHPSERIMEVENSIGKSTELTNPGCVEFELNGQPVRLEVFNAGENRVWSIFRDGTSGKTTYGAGRFVYANFNADGTVDLDFNKAYHPPCSFTYYATCPFPPRENVLSLPIEAGERFPEGEKGH